MTRDLDVRLRHRPTAADADRDRITRRPLRRPGPIEADWVIDATETGELLPLAGMEHVTGAESRDDTGEPHAPPRAPTR